MSRAGVQFNVRSAFSHARAHERAAQTGKTATQVVEDALRAHAPDPAGPRIGRLVRRGPLLVMAGGGGTISFAEAEAALNATRERDLEE